jgi:IS1 family transposase
MLDMWKHGILHFDAKHTRFHTFGQLTIQKNRRHLWRTWEPEIRKMYLYPQGKRTQRQTTQRPHLRLEKTSVTEHVIDDISQPHVLAWQDKDIYDKLRADIESEELDNELE